MVRTLMFVSSVLIGCALMLGCSEGRDDAVRYDDSPARAVAADRTTVRGEGGQRLTLLRPRDVTLRRGQAESVVIRLQRRGISDEVKVSVSNLPRGVEAVEDTRRTASDQVEIVLRASPDADLVGKHQALVTAEGPDDIRATETLEITVRER